MERAYWARPRARRNSDPGAGAAADGLRGAGRGSQRPAGVEARNPMFASLLALLSLWSSAPALPDTPATARAAPDTVIARAAADSAAALPRPVRVFPPVVVRAPLYDLRSS